MIRQGYRKIPRKIVIVGDVERGKHLIGLADSKLNELENRIRLGKLDQLSSTLEISKDILIECWSGFGLSQVRITVGGKKASKKEKMCTECLCGCHISLGVVAFSEPVACLDHILDLYFLYDVIVCQEKDKYVELQGCQSVDFTRYLDGELVYVLWVPDPPATYGDKLAGGCTMSGSSWGRLLPQLPPNSKKTVRPC